MVINLLDEILLIRLVDLFQRVVAFVRKVKTTSQYLIDSKGNALTPAYKTSFAQSILSARTGLGSLCVQSIVDLP